MTLVHFQGKPKSITVFQVFAPSTNAKEAEIDWFHEDLLHYLELTSKIDVLLIIGDFNAKVGSQKMRRTTHKFSLEVKNEAEQRLIEFCQENMLFCIQGYHYHLFKFHIYVLVYCIGLYLSGLLHINVWQKPLQYCKVIRLQLIKINEKK